jgi:DNA transformation protein
VAGPKQDPHRFDDLFSEFGPIKLRRFFGGEGIYAGDVMIGMIFDDIVYFKTDEATRKDFAAHKTEAFSFHKGKELIVTTWFAIPDGLYDDPDDLARWARDAHRVALASPAAKEKARKAVSPARPKRKR